MTLRSIRNRTAFLAFVLLLAPVWSVQTGRAELSITELGKIGPGLSAGDEQGGTMEKWTKVQELLGEDAGRVIAKQLGANLGGNTSVRSEAPLIWKDKGYFRRARDLGQVFTAPHDFTLDAIVLRTGPDYLAFLSGAKGAKVFVQFFEVTGTPAIDDNGTPPGTAATHGFSKNHRCDDFVRGVEYKPLTVVMGGRLPDLLARGDGRLTYLKWACKGSDGLRFEKDKRYAFMVGFVEPGPERNFTLANRNNASSPRPPAINDSEDTYPGGWGLRREGNGKTPPRMVPGANPPIDPAVLAQLQAESTFPEGDGHYAIAPTCEGYPDVDTYRDLEFYLIERPRDHADVPIRQIDMRPHWSDRVALENPHKGWYHHYPDNHVNKYLIGADADLLEFPGMDHLYLRLAWAYLEPQEGRFDWEVIDRIIEKWVGHGLGIAFRISCKETSTDRIEQQFATPKWVMEAGAKGGFYRSGQEVGPDGPWEPVFDDPVFLEKLENFLRAFAARYDGKPWVRYVDVGSIGDWGEGHLHSGSRKNYGYEVRKRHIDLHRKHFKKTRIVVSDDFVYAIGDERECERMHRYIVEQGLTYRDDSILVDWYITAHPATWTVRSPQYFADVWHDRPTVLELEHYRGVKGRGNWLGGPDSSLAKFGNGRSGADFFRGALATLHATYIGYHGDARDWYTDNPDLTVELLNRCGYWYFLHRVDVPETLHTDRQHPVRLVWENRGVAPAYHAYQLRMRLAGPGVQDFELPAGNRGWMPGDAKQTFTEDYSLQLPAAMTSGRYTLGVKLYYPQEDRDVLLALDPSLRDEHGYYRVDTVQVVGRP